MPIPTDVEVRFVVQCRKTDLNFVGRLTETEGIHFLTPER